MEYTLIQKFMEAQTLDVRELHWAINKKTMVVLWLVLGMISLITGGL